jgi:CRP/FNR family transcriptional regulator, cyclic AMP receptor protein
VTVIAGTLLSYLTPADRAHLLDRGVERRLPGGAALMHQGDASDHVLVLLSGWVRVSASTPDGQVILLALRGPGDVIGELAALHDRWTRTATVETLGEVRFVQLRGRDFVDCLHERSAIAVALSRQLAVRLRDADSARIDVVTLDVARRVAALVLRLARAHGRSGPSGLATGSARRGARCPGRWPPCASGTL